MELQKAKELAHAIELLKPILHTINESDLLEAEIEFFNNAGRQESAFILMPNMSPAQISLTMASYEALKHIRLLIKSLKECDRLKAEIARHSARSAEINRMFGLFE